MSIALTIIGCIEAAAGAVLALGGTIYAALMFMPAEGKTLQDLIGVLAALTAVAGILLFFAGLGLARRRRYGRWLNIVLSPLLVAFIGVGFLLLWATRRRSTAGLTALTLLVAYPVVLGVISPLVRAWNTGRIPTPPIRRRA